VYLESIIGINSEDIELRNSLNCDVFITQK